MLEKRTASPFVSGSLKRQEKPSRTDIPSPSTNLQKQGMQMSVIAIRTALT